MEKIHPKNIYALHWHGLIIAPTTMHGSLKLMESLLGMALRSSNRLNDAHFTWLFIPRSDKTVWEVNYWNLRWTVLVKLGQSPFLFMQMNKIMPRTYS